MGQTLSEPVTEKHSDAGEDLRYLYGASEMQGWRVSMEDAHSTCMQLDKDDLNAFYAVFDGHGGKSAAKFAGNRLHKRLAEEETYRNKDYRSALKRAFLGTDDELRADPTFFRDPSGCTAVAALVTTDRKIFVANAGDSRSVLSLKGEAKPLSFDHKPQNEGESARIKAAGGWVEFGRVNGNLALSRALGDFEFKQNYSLEPELQVVTSDPEITEHDCTDEDEFLVLACDGIWDCLTSQQVIDIVRREIANRKELKVICEELMDRCLSPDSDLSAGLGCDNMTVVIVALLNGRTKDEWYEWVAERVSRGHGYETPAELPQLYAASRIAAARERWASPAARTNAFNRVGGGGLGALARVFGNNITFHPTGGISGDNNDLMFDGDDSSEEYESGEEGLTAPPQGDVNQHLRAGLGELRDSEEDQDDKDDKALQKAWSIDADGDSQMTEATDSNGTSLTNSAIYSRRNIKPKDSGSSEDSPPAENPSSNIKSPLSQPTCTGSPLIRSPSPLSNFAKPGSPAINGTQHELQGEAPPPPVKVNGSHSPEKQLSSEPGGDAPTKAVKAEGLMDKSEDPLIAKDT